ncbi:MULTISPECIES: hypothetical protein [Bacillus amyloliquefaciens group]|uniref:hypothetical protein n=1 Tax=Bacillus amyloliquefaciens group TaxID=1938374 RepID=UPI001BCFE7E9|nr:MULTISPECIES: hypothetical protein [Bacillus amyloliquefaciens group]MEC5261901.1 hypothetical protein [Bacillus amyloliquefaciens]QVL41483.1 hypothetical protein KH263_19815 [Bacillus velezensis]
MKRLKVPALMLSVVAVFLFGALPANAAEENVQVYDASKIIKDNNLTTSTNATYEELTDKYKLRDAKPEEITDGVKGINFDSEEELAIFLENASKAPVSEEEEIVMPESDFSVLASAKRTRKKGVEHIGAWGQINIQADFWISGSGSFYQIDSVKNIQTYASGFTWPFNWNQTGRPYGKIAKNKQSATAYGSGNVEYLLFVKGIGKWYERHVDAKVSYKIVK